MFITGLPLGYFTLVFSKLNTLSKFEWTGQQNHKRNRFFKFSFYFSFFFFTEEHDTLNANKAVYTVHYHSSMSLCSRSMKNTLLVSKDERKLLQPFQSKKVVFKPFRRGVDGAATDLQNDRC